MHKRGLFIVLEGLDRSGKSSQCKKLLDFFTGRGLASELINFPNRKIETGKMIDEYLRNSETKLWDEAVHLLYSTNRWEMKDYIHEKVKEGTNIVCDRYAYSGIAYSHAKGLDFKWWAMPDKGLPHPDLVMFVDTSAEEISKRAGFGDERYEKTEFQAKVYDAFRKMPELEKNWCDIHGEGKSIDEIYGLISGIVEEYLEKEDISEDLPNDLFNNIDS